MFTWICPQCGREVPPSYSECPNCAENRQRAAQGLPPVGSEPVAPQQPAPPPYTPPGYPPTGPYQPQAAYPAQPPQQPLPQYPPPPPPPQWQTAPVPPQLSYTLPEAPQRRGLPAWLVTILVAVIAIGVIFGIVRLLGSKGGSVADSATAASQQAAANDSSNPYAKVLEITGVRITEDAKKHARAQFLVVNHSPADLPDLELDVVLSTTTAKAGDDPVAVMTVKTGPIPANGSKDVSAALDTKLRAYELPDWQFLRASFAMKAPH
jgi:hypothetical protein